MKKEDIKPYLRHFITATLFDGRSCSGYIANPEEIQNSEDDSVFVRLINGMLAEEIRLADIKSVKLQKREDTVSIPVVDLKPGYENASTLLDEIEKDIDSYLDQQKEVEHTNDEDFIQVDENSFAKRMLDMKDELQNELDDLDDFLDMLDSVEDPSKYPKE